MSLEVLSPCCAGCKTNVPTQCATKDWLTEHTYPCGHAEFYLTLEFASLLYANNWTQEQLKTLAIQRLKNEGWSDKDTTRVLNDSSLTDWVLKAGYLEGIRVKQIGFWPTRHFGLLYCTDSEVRRDLEVIYFRVDLPEQGFTMWSVLFDQKDKSDIDLLNTLETSYDHANCILGYDKRWRNAWEEFWQQTKINKTKFKELISRYWENLAKGERDLEAEELMILIRKKLLSLISETHVT